MLLGVTSPRILRWRGRCNSFPSVTALREHSGLPPDDSSLVDLLNETRILLPGTEVFLAFLMTMPFTERFRVLDSTQRTIYLATFFATLLAVISIVTFMRVKWNAREYPYITYSAVAYTLATIATVIYRFR